jgi:hypothetical protein
MEERTSSRSGLILYALVSNPFELGLERNHTSGEYSFSSANNRRLVPCTRIKPTIVKTEITPITVIRFKRLHLSGSLGDREGIGNSKVRPSEVIRYTLL